MSILVSECLVLCEGRQGGRVVSDFPMKMWPSTTQHMFISITIVLSSHRIHIESNNKVTLIAYYYILIKFH